MNRPRILIVGASGLLGPYLLDEARRHGEVAGLSRQGPDIRCDILDAPAFTAAVADFGPDWVIQAAALTDVDACERDPDAADALNHDSVVTLVSALPPSTRLLYVSSDQVYPDRSGPFQEPQADPVNVYARSKLAGEQAALRHPGALTVRTNLFGPSRTEGRASLSDFMTRHLRERTPFKLFTDSLVSPLHMATLSELLLRMLAQGLQGVFNLGSREGTSKAEFGLMLAEHLGLSPDLAELVESAQLPGRAQRPRDMRMDVSKVEQALGIRLPSLSEEIAKL